MDHKDLVAIEQLTILVEYKEFQHLFKQLEQIKLPEYRPYDHKILLMEGKEPIYKKIYIISEKELKLLKEYINE